MSKRQFRVDVSNGRYQLIDEQNGPVEEVNKFLYGIRIRSLSRETERAYAYDLLILYRWLQRTGKQLLKLEATDLPAFVQAQLDTGAKPKSINRRLSTCRQLYLFSTGRELDAGDKGVSRPSPHYRGRDRQLGIHILPRQHRRKLSVKIPRRLIEPLNREQVLLFLRKLHRYRDLAIVYLMLLCGLRSREVLYLQLKDINFEEHKVRIRGKGDKERMLPLPDILWDIICSYLRYERPPSLGPLFVVLQGHRRGEAMTPAGLRKLFRHRRQIPALANANAHRWRHTFGSDMARSGVRLPILQKMMGHAHAQTTLQYINLSMADIAEEYKRAIEKIKERYEPESTSD
jgi:site-specific recombinase XerD